VDLDQTWTRPGPDLLGDCHRLPSDFRYYTIVPKFPYILQFFSDKSVENSLSYCSAKFHRHIVRSIVMSQCDHGCTKFGYQLILEACVSKTSVHFGPKLIEDEVIKKIIVDFTFKG